MPVRIGETGLTVTAMYLVEQVGDRRELGPARTRSRDVVGDERARANHEVMAVAGILVDIVVSDAAASARLVDEIHLRGHEPPFLKDLDHDTADAIGAAARRIGRDELDRPVRFPFLCCGCSETDRRGDECQCHAPRAEKSARP